MAYASPTFLFQNRFGTYYFRCRIPQSVKSKYQTKKAEVRKSLSTKDYRTALELARRLWVHMFDNDFLLSSRTSPTLPEPKLSAKPIHNIPEEPSLKSNLHTCENDNLNPEIKLSDLVDKYCRENETRWNGSFEHKEVRPIMSILLELIGDKECNSVNLHDIVNFKEVFTQLPKNRKKIRQYRDKSLKELLALDIPKEDLLSLTTVKKCFIILIAFLTWCADNNFLSNDLARPLQRYNKQNKKTHRDYEEREPFDDSDLKKLFESKVLISVQ